MIRTRLLGAACFAMVGLLLAGCVSGVAGRPQASVCVLHDVASCRDHRPTEPARGPDLFDVWIRDRGAAADMLCSAVPDEKLTSLMDTDSHYRYVQLKAGACVVSTDSSTIDPETGRLPQQFQVQTTVVNEATAAYGTPTGPEDPLAEMLEPVEIAGFPGFRLQNDAFGGERRVEYYLAASRNMSTPATFIVELSVLRPRGDMTERPLDYSALENEQAIVQSYLEALFA